MVRIAIIDKSKCKPDLCNNECMLYCPVNVTGGKCITREGKEKPKIDENLCTGCGICIKRCPFNAIKIINLPELKSERPIHQFGPNAFRLFSLPQIQEGIVSGILGRNGIGKTTAINILSNTIKANFGVFEKTYKDDKEYLETLNKEFKGTVLQNFFEKLINGKINVAYKPQLIERIPVNYSGKVIDLLKKVNNDENRLNEIVEKLNIKNILENDIKNLSGGELQKVAIASTLIKTDINFYIFDEITNYLDLYERLNTSKVITNEVNGKTTFIIEHDLTILDYLTERISIIYGEPGAYGITTNVKSTKLAINEYLEGYSKDENVRFRDKKIVFEKDSINDLKKSPYLTSWESETIKKGNFKLNIESGNIRKKEIIGIIGRNGLGKSTFIEYLSKQKLNFEEGSEDREIKVSFKPQLIERDDNLVIDILSSLENFNDTFYKEYILKPLMIENLLNKKVDELSGGELQRFAIAKTLLKDADLFLLDEPTAFLDIEDRLIVSKILRNFVSIKEKAALIIDHDLIFIDYLSDRLQVFYGEPAKEGFSKEPTDMRTGMNFFLKELNITFRRDELNKRPRVNKLNSVKDKSQKEKGEYYYS